MRRRRFVLILLASLAVAVAGTASPSGQTGPGPSTHGSFAIHMILHAVGEETYDIATNPDGTRTLTTTLDYTDRASKRTTTATLTTTKDERRVKLEIKGGAASTMALSGATTTIEMRAPSVTSPTPPGAAVIG